MGQKLPPEEMELYRRVDEVLHYLWDPIGISSVPEARSEYYSYLPHVFSMLNRAASAAEIADYLTGAASYEMGFPDTRFGQEHSLKIAAILQQWREVIRSQYARNA